jgi:glycosyltransferase involved in cell wall biosynthesis
MKQKLLSIVVPLRNEAENLETLHGRLSEVAAKLDRDSEFIFIDDGSSDRSYQVLLKMRERDPRVCVIRLSRNFGSHSACLAGFCRARGDHAVILAADLQDPPELVTKLLSAADDGHDIVWANREDRNDPPLTVMFASAYNRIMKSIAMPNWPDKGFDLVLVSRRVLDVLVSRQESNTSLFGQILWTGFAQTSIGYKRDARRSGKSKWTFARKLKLAIDSFVSFSYVPIRLISLFGLVSALAGVLYAGLVVTVRLTRGSPVEGWASLMVVVLVLGGVQLLMLGVIGEYLWRTLDETRRRPPFIISEALGFEEDAWSRSQARGS